jgi:hypothetical protein
MREILPVVSLSSGNGVMIKLTGCPFFGAYHIRGSWTTSIISPSLTLFYYSSAISQIFLPEVDTGGFFAIISG